MIISSARANLKQFNVRMRTDLADAVDTAEKIASPNFLKSTFLGVILAGL